MARILIGIVGYCQFVRAYALGPVLMERLQALAWPGPVEIRDMNWGPIAIVQELQASAEKYERVVLVGAVDRGLAAGSVTCHRWKGRVQDLLAVQRRVFEAVTGVVGIDNLLVIGAHFRVWPDQLFSVEAQLPDSSFGDLVLAEMQAAAAGGQGAVIGERALAPADLQLVERIARTTRQAALDGAGATAQSLDLAGGTLAPVVGVCHYDFMDRGGAVRAPDGQEQAR